MRRFLDHPRHRLAVLLAVLTALLTACDTSIDDTVRVWLTPVARAIEGDGDGGRDDLFFNDDDVVGLPDQALTPDDDLLLEDDELPFEEDEVVGIEDERVREPAAATPTGTLTPTATAGTPQPGTPTPTNTATSTPIPTSTPASAATSTPLPTQTRVFGDDEVGLQNMGIEWQGNRFELTGRVDAIYEGAGFFDVSYPTEFAGQRTRSIYLRPGMTFADYNFVEGDVVSIRGVRELNNYLFADAIQVESSGS